MRNTSKASGAMLQTAGRKARAVLAGAACAIALLLVVPVHAGAAIDLYKWTEKAAPDYVVSWGKAKGASKAPAAGKIAYSKLDRLGRTRKAKGTITYKMVTRAAQRGKQVIPYSAKPSGWGHNTLATLVLGDGTTRRYFFWNRSHLIADSLGGAPKRRNLITGTRMQNVGVYDDRGGMAYCETLVRTWLYRNHNGSVFYSVKPVYKEDELVARSVIVDMKSSDATLNRRFVVYNAARGYKIDYATGTFKAKKKQPGKVALPTPSPAHRAYTTAYGERYHSTKLCEGLVYASKLKKTTCAKAQASGKSVCSLCWRD